MTIKITCEITLRSYENEKEGIGRYSALSIDTDEPDFLEKIKDHIEVFRTIVREYNNE